MTGWCLTDADSADISALARILGDWVRETEWMPVLHSHQDDEGFVEGLLKTHAVRVARLGADRLGFLARRGGRVQALHIASGSRGLGIGKALLDEVKATEVEIELWTFQANERALAFYRREGFCVEAMTDGNANEEGLPDVCLIWRSMQ